MAGITDINGIAPKCYTCPICNQSFSCSQAIGGHTKGHVKMPNFVSKREKARQHSAALKVARAAKLRNALAVKAAKARAKASRNASAASLQAPSDWASMLQRILLFNQQYGVLVKTEVGGGGLIYAPKQPVEKLDLTLRLGRA